MKIRTPNSPCTDHTLFWGHFYGFLRCVVWPNSGHFLGVYQSHYCASEGTFFVFSLCNVSEYCFIFVWKANEVKFKKRLLPRCTCMHHFKSDIINDMDHMRISGTEPSSVILSQRK